MLPSSPTQENLFSFEPSYLPFYHSKLFFTSQSKIYLTSLATIFALSAWAQGTITGKVVDDGGEALIGVNIVVQGTATGTTTDFDETYSIQMPDQNAVLNLLTSVTLPDLSP